MPAFRDDAPAPFSCFAQSASISRKISRSNCFGTAISAADDLAGMAHDLGARPRRRSSPVFPAG
jgi:hypothetical protein